MTRPAASLRYHDADGARITLPRFRLLSADPEYGHLIVTRIRGADEWVQVETRWNAVGVPLEDTTTPPPVWVSTITGGALHGRKRTACTRTGAHRVHDELVAVALASPRSKTPERSA